MSHAPGGGDDPWPWWYDSRRNGTKRFEEDTASSANSNTDDRPIISIARTTDRITNNPVVRVDCSKLVCTLGYERSDAFVSILINTIRDKCRRNCGISWAPDHRLCFVSRNINSTDALVEQTVNSIKLLAKVADIDYDITISDEIK